MSRGIREWQMATEVDEKRHAMHIFRILFILLAPMSDSNIFIRDFPSTFAAINFREAKYGRTNFKLSTVIVFCMLHVIHPHRCGYIYAKQGILSFAPIAPIPVAQILYIPHKSVSPAAARTQHIRRAPHTHTQHATGGNLPNCVKIEDAEEKWSMQTYWGGPLGDGYRWKRWQRRRWMIANQPIWHISSAR